MTAPLPFSGMRVVVTRASHQSDSLSKKLSQLGASVELFPLLEIAPPQDWSEVDRAIDQLDQFDWIIFASVNAVNFFLQRVVARTGSSANLKHASLATIGPVTREALEEHQHYSRYHPREFIAEAFVAEFPEIENLHGKKILWPKASVGRRLIQEQLEKAGASVCAVEVYQSLLPKDAGILARELETLMERATIDVITLASAQTAKNLSIVCKELTSTALSALLKATHFVAIGPETAKALQTHVPSAKLTVATTYTSDGLVDALLNLSNHEK